MITVIEIMMHQIEIYIELIARIIDWVVILILLYGVIRTLPLMIYSEVFLSRKNARGDNFKFLDERVRGPLGRYLLLGLELSIVSDIIHTTITRTLDDLLFLGGVVIIRTILSHFLNREVMHLAKSSGGGHGDRRRGRNRPNREDK